VPQALGSLPRRLRHTPTRTKLAIHIFVSEKGDYYELNDGLPQNER
jgi:hypothetical protein